MKHVFKRLLLGSAVAALVITGTAGAQTAGDGSSGAQTGTGTTTDNTREPGTGATTDPSGIMDDDATGTDASPSGTTGGAIDDRSMGDENDSMDGNGDDGATTGDRPPRADRD